MLQIVFKHGFIDPVKFGPKRHRNPGAYYTTNGQYDTFGGKIEDSSLQRIIEKMPNFVREEILLQYIGKQIGVTVIHSPKAHPELAGGRH